MIGRFFGVAGPYVRGFAAVGADVLGALQQAWSPATDLQVRAAERATAAFHADALSDKEAEEEVAEPEWEPSYTPVTTYRCADCAWTSLNFPALRAHREREHPVAPAVQCPLGGECPSGCPRTSDHCTHFNPKWDIKGPGSFRLDGDDLLKQVAEPNPRIQPLSEAMWAEGWPQFHCDDCGGSAFDELALRAHREREHPRRPLDQSSAATPDPAAESVKSGAGTPRTAPDCAATPQCGAGHLRLPGFRCSKPSGHEGKHGYAGCFWPESLATHPTNLTSHSGCSDTAEEQTDLVGPLAAAAATFPQYTKTSVAVDPPRSRVVNRLGDNEKDATWLSKLGLTFWWEDGWYWRGSGPDHRTGRDVIEWPLVRGPFTEVLDQSSAAVDPPSPAAESPEEVVSPAPLATTSSGHPDGDEPYPCGCVTYWRSGMQRYAYMCDEHIYRCLGCGTPSFPTMECNVYGCSECTQTLAGAVSTGCSDTGQSLEEWLEPAIQEVLTEHGVFGWQFDCACDAAGIYDYRDWQDHVAPILAAHLAKALTAHQK